MSDFPVKRLYPAEIIFEEGDFGQSAYIIKQGKVKIYKRHAQRNILLAELGVGAIFGELALLTQAGLRTATAEAIDNVEVIEISKAQFEQLMQQSPTIISTLMRAFSKRIIDLTSSLTKQK